MILKFVGKGANAGTTNNHEDIGYHKSDSCLINFPHLKNLEDPTGEESKRIQESPREDKEERTEKRRVSETSSGEKWKRSSGQIPTDLEKVS